MRVWGLCRVTVFRGNANASNFSAAGDSSGYVCALKGIGRVTSGFIASIKSVQFSLQRKYARQYYRYTHMRYAPISLLNLSSDLTAE